MIALCGMFICNHNSMNVRLLKNYVICVTKSLKSKIGILLFNYIYGKFVYITLKF